MTTSNRTSPLLFALVLIISPLSLVAASAPNDVVINPYVSGCLYHHNLTSQIRVCNSDDSANTVAAGLCRQPPVPQYHDPEIRLLVQDWESAAFENWIIQFILSELLDVPTSAESGTASTQMNFYNPENKFELGLVMPMYKIALGNAHRLKDCRKANAYNNGHDDEHVLCAHFVAETWHNDYVQDMVKNGIIESPQGLGALAQEGWYVPRFTAEQDPTLLSYIGLGGEENRPKLAARFKRPTTWKDYCDQVSLNNCTNTSDPVTKRAPQNDMENDRMFVEGIFTGYFRFTDKNDCELNPTTCTGHFMDYPCSWRSTSVTQAHYLNIAVDGDGPEATYLHGYPASQIEETWRAANATRSDVIAFWYTPSGLYGDFLGSDFEFTAVSMPTATQECVEHRVSSDERCSNDPVLQVGDARGACQDPPNALQSIIVSNLFHLMRGGGDDPSIPEEVRSPAYDMLKRFRITELQLVKIFGKLHETNGEPRQAVCDWAAENIEYLRSFIPASYPRRFEQQQPNASLMYAASILGGIVVICVMMTAALVYRQRRCRLIQRLQVDFLWLSLGGLFLVAIGALVMAPPQSNGTCIATIWLVNLGYTILLVPLMVKVNAINSVSRAATRFRRKTISRATLFRNCAFITSLVVIFLILWTSIDTPKIENEYQMVDFDNGVVAVSVFCSSNSSAWNYVSVGWVALLLFGTSILAFQMQKLTMEEFCETPTLCLMVYSHLFFVLCRLTTYFLHSNVSEYVLSRAVSLILSADTLAAMMIYFVPKIVLSFSRDRPGSSLPVANSRSSWTFTPGPPDGSSSQLRMQQEHQEVVAILKEEICILKEELKNLKDVKGYCQSPNVSSSSPSPVISSSSSTQVAPAP